MSRLFVLFLLITGCQCGGPRLMNALEEPDAGEIDAGVFDAGCVMAAEVCNGLDDDCNGQVDEGLMPSLCGVGECAAVSATCAAGQPVACQPRPSGTETCNGLDDDCDGTVDEGLVNNTSGDVRITNDPGSSDFVYMGAGPDSFALAWQDGRDGSPMKGEIYFARLTRTGQKQGSDVRITSTRGTSAHPAMAFVQGRWALVYADDTTDNLELYVRFIATDGTLMGQAVRLTNASGDSDWPDVVATVDGFAVAWQDERNSMAGSDVWVRRFDAQGRPLAAEIRVTDATGAQGNPILKTNGQGFVVAWHDGRGGRGRDIFLRRLDASLQPVVAEVRVSDEPADSAWPDLAWNGVAREWAVVWHDARFQETEILMRRYSEMLQPLSAEVRITNETGASSYPSIDFNGFQYGLSWQDARDGQPAIMFAPVNAQGTKTAAEVRLSSGSGTSSFTTALWNGSNFAFGWRDDRNGNTELYFALVGCAR
jgi:hypothetical protein